jgi:hypothetical protein
MEFQCNVCAKIFSRNAGLKRHKESVHGAGSFSCDKCFKTFNRNDAYVRHERTCSIICKYCDPGFDSGSELSIHVQSQHTDKKYMCSKCVKKYIEKRDLKKHQQKCTNTVSVNTQCKSESLQNWIKYSLYKRTHYLTHNNAHFYTSETLTGSEVCSGPVHKSTPFSENWKEINNWYQMNNNILYKSRNYKVFNA